MKYCYTTDLRGKKKKNPWEPFVLPALLVTPCRIQFFTYCNQNHIYLPVIQI